MGWKPPDKSIKRITWADLMARDDIIGGDLETRDSTESNRRTCTREEDDTQEIGDGEDIFRGPIKSIRREGSGVLVCFDWCASKTRDEHGRSGPWIESIVLTLNIHAPILKELPSGRISFPLATPTGYAIIYPRGTGALSRAAVHIRRVTHGL